MGGAECTADAECTESYIYNIASDNAIASFALGFSDFSQKHSLFYNYDLMI